MKRIAAAALAATLVLTGCVTNTRVTFTTDPQGAEVYLAGRPLGESPAQANVSNAAWDDPVVKIHADGYKDYIGTLDKEIKMVNGVFGLLLWWPSLLWVWGPQPVQYFQLIEE